MKYRLLRCYSPSGNEQAMPVDGDSSGSTMTWDDIKPANPDDIQTGRNVYIEVKNVNGVFMTKASAEKIISCIKEGFMPVLKALSVPPATEEHPEGHVTFWNSVSFLEYPNGMCALDIPNTPLYSDPNGDLSKPFTSIEPSESSSEDNGPII